ncbi:MAG: hypothetical protein NZ750_10080 [Anaerolineae bacterium]|nr:hypothetical protein [Anaerolineae bacterium]MDW8172630.1 hypothetical protein [Anaerolineae bacterium]
MSEPAAKPPASAYEDPAQALVEVQLRLRALIAEYANGAINMAQFNALYHYLVERRMTLERSLSDPDAEDWHEAAKGGMTGELRNRFQARLIFLAVFRQATEQPLFVSGKLPAKAAQSVAHLVRTLWAKAAWQAGIFRYSIGQGYWLVVVMGEARTMSLATFSLAPAPLQVNQLRDLHTDFERANRSALARQLPPDRMVFPQRALVSTL